MKIRLMLIATIMSVSIVAQEAIAVDGWPSGSFDDAGVARVPQCAGVYIIYKDDTPYYVGRSRVNIYQRLYRHLNGNGSKKIAEILDGDYKLTMAYECLDSVEQMESQLIDALGTTNFGNLRRETDPADWE
ncbi:GIY-YIG nuclease family protein [Thiothrix subterranea]|uniref:GIY-YIG nuclease family protein n=1 Tax=Thiothrix subterranea TaxID=2735563 RepID=UPI00192B0687|nr:GIY-YIG nuclease family protein [Thiothrix subterranea]QQZ28863.1 GIY-YIG nuclease family protein [Thiothrix subterranea]